MKQMKTTHSFPATGQPTRLRLLLLPLAIFLLLTALWAGLIRLGWRWPPLQPTLPMAHGPLMVCGFLGTLISLERALGLGRRWAYSAPVLTGVGALLLVAGVQSALGPLLITLGSLVLVSVLVQIVRIQPALFTITIALGGLLWAVGNGLWLAGRPVPDVVLWWMGFLVLTIVGERLELSRILRLSTLTYSLFFLSISLFIVGLCSTLFAFDLGVRLIGGGLIAQSLWLLRYDIARRRLKSGGQARFIAISLLIGYGWLGVGGGLALLNGGWRAGPLYDAFLHAVFLGFVFSMIFAHALIIFPAVLGIPLVYSSRFYSHLALLHLSLLLRISSDWLPWGPGRLWGGLLNGIALLLFLINTVAALDRTRRL